MLRASPGCSQFRSRDELLTSFEPAGNREYAPAEDEFTRNPMAAGSSGGDKRRFTSMARSGWSREPAG